jgi:hypothetical protein
MGQSGHQGLGRTGHYRRKTDDRSYGNHYDNVIVTADIDGNFDRARAAGPARLGLLFHTRDDCII